MNKINDAINFYGQHYDILDQWLLQPGDKVVLGDKDDRHCRFCGHGEPDVTFKLEAHAIPEALGNKSLATNYECDTCNQMFGRGIENDFGNWSKPMRTMSRINGKKGVPTIKKGSSGGWRIEYGPSGFQVTQYEDNPAFEIDDAKQRITVKLHRDSYTPIAVLKAFVKMGLSVFPDSEINNFRNALSWVSCLDHQSGLVSEFPIIHTFIPGPMPNDKICLTTFRRKNDELEVPYAFFVLGYGNEVFQVIIPCPERDQLINGKEMKLPPFPNPRDLSPSEFGPSKVGPLDLTEREPVKGETTTIQMGYAEAVRTDLKSKNSDNGVE